MNWIRRWEPWLAVGGGILAALSMPGLGAAPLVFVALIPLFAALDRAHRVREGFLYGYLFGIAFFAIEVRWVLTLMRFNPLVAAGYPVLVAYLALPIGIVGGLMAWRSDRISRWTWLLLAPALIVLAEAFRTLGTLGMGFSMLHQALYRIPWLIQSAGVFGSWFVTSAIVAINAALFLAWRERGASRTGGLRHAITAVGLFLLLPAFWLLPAWEAIDDPSLAIAVVSSNVDQAFKLDARNLPVLVDRFLVLGESAIATEPDLVVFPESFLPAYILDADAAFGRLADLARRGDTRLLFGTGTYRNGEIYNSVALVDESGDVLATYDMLRPVPFGEYVPGRGLLEAIGLGAWAKALLPIDLTRGNDYRPLDGIGTPICFESTFPTASRRLTRAGASLLVTVTNDAWFGGSSELRAHFATAVFRAVENRRAVVQAANGGVSGFVDARGRIVAETTDETVTTARVRHSEVRSLYTQWGDGPWLFLMGGVAAGHLAWRLRRLRKGTRE